MVWARRKALRLEKKCELLTLISADGLSTISTLAKVSSDPQ